MKFENVHLLTHRGGDSAHFIMWSLFRFCSGVGDQRWTDNPIHTDRNSYDGWESAVRHKQNREYHHIDVAIEEKRKWFEDDNFYAIRGYDMNKVYIQQIHSLPPICKREYIGNNPLMAITVKDDAYQWRITQLDVIKQYGYMSDEDKLEYPEIAGNVASEYSQHALYVPDDNTSVYYIDYDRLIGNANYDEFARLADHLKLSITASNYEIEDAIMQYNTDNDRVLELYETFGSAEESRFFKAYHGALRNKSFNVVNGIDKYRTLY